MAVYTTITITNAPTLTEAKLDEALERSAFADAFHDICTYPTDNPGWAITGNCKYSDGEGDTLAEDLSARHPGSRVELREEWDTRDADTPGQNVRLYIAGEHVVEADRTQGLVPTDLEKSLAALRDALAGNGDLPRAAEWLADGLDGSRGEIPDEPITVTSVTVMDEWGTDHSQAFASRFDYTPVVAKKRRALSAEESPSEQLRTRESVQEIIQAWIASAEAHTSRKYGVEWLDTAGAYAIACWTGEKVELSAIYSDGDRDEIAFDALVDALHLRVITRWSDGVIS